MLAAEGSVNGGNRFRIGTRKSAMALAQTEEIARRLTAAVPGIEVEIVKFETTGDTDQTSKLLPHGGKGGAFVAANPRRRARRANCMRRCIRSRTCRAMRTRRGS